MHRRAATASLALAAALLTACEREAVAPPVAPPAPPPAVVEATPTPKASPAQALREVIDAHKDEVFRCYNARRAADPTLRGRVLITWDVAPDGTSTVSFATSMNEVLQRAMGDAPTARPRTLADDDALQACIRAIAMPFPPSQERARNLTLPWVFGMKAKQIEVTVLDVDGIELEDAQASASSTLRMIGRGCLDGRARESAVPDVDLEWTRLDDIDMVLPGPGSDTPFGACVLAAAPSYRPFPKLVAGSVRMRVRVVDVP